MRRNPKSLLRDAGFQQRKNLGQHFLHDARILGAIADAVAHEARACSPAGVAPLPVVEIGTGPGTLTLQLLERGLRVLGIEADQRFRPIHQQLWKDAPADAQPALHYGDACHIPPEVIRAFVGECPRYILAGNIPYQITSPLLFGALDALRQGQSPCPAAIVFLMQEEVAQRIAAEPDSRVYGVLSIKMQWLMQPRLGLRVGPGAFQPPPQVHSRVLVARARPESEQPDREVMQRAWRLVDHLFQQRRKRVDGLLARDRQVPREELAQWFATRDLPDSARPENLSPADYLELVGWLAARP